MAIRTTAEILKAIDHELALRTRLFHTIVNSADESLDEIVNAVRSIDASRARQRTLEWVLGEHDILA